MIDWAASGLALAKGGEAFPGAGRPTGAVSSFGFSGTNAHIIIAAAADTPAVERPASTTSWSETRFWVPEAEPVAVAPAPPQERRGRLYLTEMVPVQVAAGQPPAGPVIVTGSNTGLAVSILEVLRGRGVRAEHSPDGASAFPPGASVLICPGSEAGRELATVHELVARARQCRVSAIAALSDPAGEAVFAYLRSAFIDHPAMAGSLIAAAPGVAAGRLADALAHKAGRQITALAGRFLTPRLVLAGEGARQPFAASAERPYLVTGGYGSVGLALASWLIARGARHIVLAGRTAPSDTIRIADAAADAALWSRVLGWRAQGVKVSLASADVADGQAMREVLARDCPELAGIIHAAGVSNAGGTGLPLEAILRAKVEGSLVIEDLCAGLDLDLLLFCSSAAVWGGAGLASYAAANAFMDAVARRCGAKSVQFGGWQGSRMLADGDLRAFQERRGFAALLPERMLELLDAALRQESPVVAAVDLDCAVYRRSLTPAGLDDFMERLVPKEEGPAEGLRDKVLAAHPRRRCAMVLRLVQEEAARLLGHPEPQSLGPDEALLNLGFNSLVAVEFRDALAASLGLELSSTLVYANPTLRAVADHVVQRLNEAEEPVQDGRVAEAHGRLASLLAGYGT